MKKYIVMLACVASTLIIASCSNDDSENVVENPKVKTFLVASPSGSTRAAVNDLEHGDLKVKWEGTDHILVWGEGLSATGSDFGYDTTPNPIYPNTAAFKGTIDESNKYYLMYPKQDGASIEFGTAGVSSTIIATIPATQKATSNSFDPSAAICVGATKTKADKSVSILHVCSFLKITTSAPCEDITVSAATNDDWYLAGKVKIEASSSGGKILSPASAGFVEGAKQVKLVPSSGTAIPAGTYLIAIAPSTAFPGIKAVVKYSNTNIVTKSKDDNFTFDAGFIYNLGTAPTSN